MLKRTRLADGRTRRLAFGLLFSPLLAAACTPWHAGSLPAPGAPPGAGEGRDVRARVVLADGRRVELRGLAVRDDSVVGYRGPTDDARWRFAAPVSEVVSVERADFTFARTTGNAVAGGYAAVALGGIAFTLWLLGMGRL